jgi:hypothetical protein
MTQYFVVLGIVVGDACGEEHRARAHRPAMDDDPRHGHRG